MRNDLERWQAIIRLIVAYDDEGLGTARCVTKNNKSARRKQRPPEKLIQSLNRKEEVTYRTAEAMKKSHPMNVRSHIDLGDTEMNDFSRDELCIIVQSIW